MMNKTKIFLDNKYQITLINEKLHTETLQYLFAIGIVQFFLFSECNCFCALYLVLVNKYKNSQKNIKNILAYIFLNISRYKKIMS